MVHEVPLLQVRLKACFSLLIEALLIKPVMFALTTSKYKGDLHKKTFCSPQIPSSPIGPGGPGGPIAPGTPGRPSCPSGPGGPISPSGPGGPIGPGGHLIHPGGLSEG